HLRVAKVVFFDTDGDLLLEDRQEGQRRAIENRPRAGRGTEGEPHHVKQRAGLWKRRIARMAIARVSLGLEARRHVHLYPHGLIDVAEMHWCLRRRSRWRSCHRLSRRDSTAQAADPLGDAKESVRSSWRFRFLRH